MNVICQTKQSAKLCWRKICVKSAGYKALQGVFSAKTKHPGGILMDAPE